MHPAVQAAAKALGLPRGSEQWVLAIAAVIIALVLRMVVKLACKRGSKASSDVVVIAGECNSGKTALLHQVRPAVERGAVGSEQPCYSFVFHTVGASRGVPSLTQPGVWQACACARWMACVTVVGAAVRACVAGMLVRQLVHGSVPETVSSINVTEKRAKLHSEAADDSAPTYRFVDLPGHHSLCRSPFRSLTPYLSSLRCIVVVVDSTNSQRSHFHDVAE